VCSHFKPYLCKMLKNDLLLRTARGESTERTPVWLMRQAGRVLPEYRAVRMNAGGFIEMVKNPEFAAEVTIQPVTILGVDAAIIFSDILVVPEAMGLPYKMVEAMGPWFEHTIATEADLARIHVSDGSEIKYVADAIALTKKNLDHAVPLIGFAGAPWTLFAYMVEGKGSKTFSKAKQLLYTNPTLAHQLLQMITDTTIAYIKTQVAAGVNLIQLFDSWAGVLSPMQYNEFSIEYIKQITDAITTVPTTVFAKGAFFARASLNKLSCNVVGLDWNMDIAESKVLLANKVLQGNADPCLLYADEATIVQQTEKMLHDFGPSGHIANLGHGLYPDLEKSKVKLFVDTVKAYRHGSK
jgi:uroporphyrinogen decarboxylase